jgi:DNA modification methylase
MDGNKAKFMFTDPPWNVDYGGAAHPSWKQRSILNDKMTSEQFAEFLTKAFSCAKEAMEVGGMTYVVMSGQEWGNIMRVMEALGFHWSSTIIWKKDTLVLSRKDYHTQFEPIWYGWIDGTRLCPLTDRKQSDVWDIARPKRSELHPTTKPVELVARAILNSSHKGELCIDLFGGSGTTLIASEQTERLCYMMELDEKYADVIVKRYIDNGRGTEYSLLHSKLFRLFACGKHCEDNHCSAGRYLICSVLQ